MIDATLWRRVGLRTSISDDLAGQRHPGDVVGTVVGASRCGLSLITTEARLRFEDRTESVRCVRLA